MNENNSEGMVSTREDIVKADISNKEKQRMKHHPNTCRPHLKLFGSAISEKWTDCE